MMGEEQDQTTRPRWQILSGTLAGLCLVSGATQAQEVPSFNLYGLPGLVDMPTAEAAPDATLGLTYGLIGDSNRGSLIFQITPNRDIPLYGYQQLHCPGRRGRRLLRPQFRSALSALG